MFRFIKTDPDLLRENGSRRCYWFFGTTLGDAIALSDNYCYAEMLLHMVSTLVSPRMFG